MKELTKSETMALSIAVDHYLDTNKPNTKEKIIFSNILISAKNKLDERTN